MQPHSSQSPAVDFVTTKLENPADRFTDDCRPPEKRSEGYRIYALFEIASSGQRAFLWRYSETNNPLQPVGRICKTAETRSTVQSISGIGPLPGQISILNFSQHNLTHLSRHCSGDTAYSYTALLTWIFLCLQQHLCSSWPPCKSIPPVL